MQRLAISDGYKLLFKASLCRIDMFQSLNFTISCVFFRLLNYGINEELYQFIMSQQKADQDIKSLLVKYYQSKKEIPNLVGEDEKKKLTLEKQFIELKLLQDDLYVKDTYLTIDNLLEKPQDDCIRTIIKGGPGSGKSIILDKIAYNWAKDVKENKKNFDFEYVFRIDLKKIETAKVKDQTNFYKIIFNCLKDAFEQKKKGDDKPDDLIKRLEDQMDSIFKKTRNSKLLFLLDGYDGVKHFEGDDSKSQLTVLTEIFKGIEKHNTIVTSRPQAVENSKILEKFEKYIQIQPIQEKQINQFIDKLFEDQNRKKAIELKKHIKSNKNVMRMIQNPLNLTMACFIFMNDSGQKSALKKNQTINEIFLYDKIIKLITLRQEKKEYMNDFDKGDLEKTVKQGTLYEQIQPLNLLKKTVYNVFTKGTNIIKKDDIGRSSDKKYDDKRKAIRRTIEFGLLTTKKVDSAQLYEIDKIVQLAEEYTFVQLSFAEYLFAYSIFEKLKNYIPLNLQNDNKQTTEKQLSQITSFIANNRYKLSYFNAFRYLTMLCSKFYNEQRSKYERNQLQKKKKMKDQDGNSKSKIEERRYFKFPLETIWICYTCNIDGVLQFGRQQQLKLIIEMKGLSNYKSAQQGKNIKVVNYNLSSSIQILDVVKKQYLQPYFSLQNPLTKETNKKAITRWYKYFIASNYFPSQLTKEFVEEIKLYFEQKDGKIRLNHILKPDEDFIIAFCQVISCIASSQSNRYFTDDEQHKVECLKYFIRLLKETSSSNNLRIKLAVLSNLQDLFYSLSQEQGIKQMFKNKQQQKTQLDIINILLDQLKIQQTNDKAFSLLCYFIKKQQQIMSQRSKRDQPQKEKKSNIPSVSVVQLLLPDTMSIPSLLPQSQNLEASKNDNVSLTNQQIYKFIKQNSIRKRILVALKQSLKEMYEIKYNIQLQTVEQFALFSQIFDDRLAAEATEATEAEDCKALIQQIKTLFFDNIKVLLEQLQGIQQKKKDDIMTQSDVKFVTTINTLVKNKFIIYFKFQTKFLATPQQKEILVRYDQINTKMQIIYSEKQPNTPEIVISLNKLIAGKTKPSQGTDKYIKSIEKFYLNKEISIGYGHYIKGDAFYTFMIDTIAQMKTNYEKQQQRIIIQIFRQKIIAILKFMSRQNIATIMTSFSQIYLNSSARRKLFEDDFQIGLYYLLNLLNQSIQYLDENVIKDILSGFLPYMHQVALKVVSMGKTINNNPFVVKQKEIKNVEEKELDDYIKSKTNQKRDPTKQLAIVEGISFLSRAALLQQQDQILNILRNIIIPLAFYFNPKEQKTIKYFNQTRQAVIEYIQSIFQIIQPQKVLDFLKQIASNIKATPKNTNNKPKKTKEQKLRNRVRKQKNKVNRRRKEESEKKKKVFQQISQQVFLKKKAFNQTQLSLQIITIGFNFLPNSLKVDFIKTHAYLFSNKDESGQYDFLRKGILIMNASFCYLKKYKQYDLQYIFSELIQQINYEYEDEDKKHYINYFNHAINIFDNISRSQDTQNEFNDIKSRLIVSLVKAIANDEYVIENALDLCLLAFQSIADQYALTNLSNALIPLLGSKHKKIRIRALKLLQLWIKKVIQSDDSMEVIFDQSCTIRQYLQQRNNKGKINALYLLKQALPFLHERYYQDFIFSTVNKTRPLLQDNDVKVSKAAIYFMGKVMSLDILQEQQGRQIFSYIDKLLYLENFEKKTIVYQKKVKSPSQKKQQQVAKNTNTQYSKIKQIYQQICFSATIFMKQALQSERHQISKLTFQKIQKNFLSIPKDKSFQKQLQVQRYNKSEKTLYNIAYNFITSCIYRLTSQLKYNLFQACISSQNQQVFQMTGYISQKYQQTQQQINPHVLVIIQGFLENMNEKQHLQAQKYFMLLQRIMMDSTQKKLTQINKLGKKLDETHKNVGKYQKIGYLCLFKSICQYLNIETLKSLKQSLISPLLRDPDDDVCNSAINSVYQTIEHLNQSSKIFIIKSIIDLRNQYSLTIKQSVFRCMANYLHNIEKQNNYNETVDKIIQTIRDFIKGRKRTEPNNLDKPRQSQMYASLKQSSSRLKNKTHIKDQQMSQQESQQDEQYGYYYYQQQENPQVKIFEHMTTLMYNFLKQDSEHPLEQKDKKVKEQIFTNIIIPSLLDQQKAICNKSFLFIRNCIYDEKIDAKELINYMIAIVNKKQVIEEEQPLQFIKDFIQFLRSEQQFDEVIPKFVPLFNKVTQRDRIKIKKLLKFSFNIFDLEKQVQLFNTIIHDFQILTYDKLYFIEIILPFFQKQRQRIQKNAIRVVEQINDKNMQIKAKIISIVSIALPKTENKIKNTQLIKKILDDCIGMNDKPVEYDLKIIKLFTKSLPYINPQEFSNYFEYIKNSLVSGGDGFIRKETIHFLSEIKNHLKDNENKTFFSQFLPILKSNNLEFDDNVTLLNIMKQYITKAENEDAIKYLSPFFEVQDEKQFYVRVKQVQQVIPSLQRYAQIIILDKSSQLIKRGDPLSINEGIKILDAGISVLENLNKQAFSTVLKFIGFINQKQQSKNELDMPKICNIIKKGIFYSNPTQRALLLLFLISKLQTFDDVVIETNSIVSAVSDTILKKISLKKQKEKVLLNNKLQILKPFLHQNVSLVNIVRVIMEQTHKQLIAKDFFQKIITLQGIYARQPVFLRQLLASYPELNPAVISKISKSNYTFKGANFTILIELAKSNHELYGAVLENYSKILDQSEDYIRKDLKELNKKPQSDKPQPNPNDKKLQKRGPQNPSNQDPQELKPPQKEPQEKVDDKKIGEPSENVDDKKIGELSENVDDKKVGNGMPNKPKIQVKYLTLLQKIKAKQVDLQSLFTQQLIKRYMKISLEDSDLSKQDALLLNLCIQCDLTISFRYTYKQKKDGFQNEYQKSYGIDFGDKTFTIAKGIEDYFFILRDLFNKNGKRYADHNNIFKNQEKNGFKKAAIDTVACQQMFLSHKKIISKINSSDYDIKQKDKYVQVDWDKIHLIHLTSQEKDKKQKINVYLIMRRDQFGNYTARKFDAIKIANKVKEEEEEANKNKQKQQSQKSYYGYQSQSANVQQTQQQKEIQAKPVEKDFKDYILPLNQAKEDMLAFKIQLIGQNSEDKRKQYAIQTVKMSLIDFQKSHTWKLADVQNFVKQKSKSRNDYVLNLGKFPKWVIVGQKIKPYDLMAEDIQNIDQILAMTGLTTKSNLKKELKNMGSTKQEKQMVAQYAKIAYWKLLNTVQSYGLVDCGIMKKDQAHRTREDQFKMHDTAQMVIGFFGESAAEIPIFGGIASKCITFLSEKIAQNLDSQQKNLGNAFIILFQESSASFEQRNLLIDQVILELTKMRLKQILAPQQPQDPSKFPFMQSAFKSVLDLKQAFDNLGAQQQIASKLAGKKTSIMAKFDIATLAMSIMSHQSEIAELGPTKDQVPQLLMKYLEDQIETDVKTQEKSATTKLRQCLLTFENCCRFEDNQKYQFKGKGCMQKFKIYLGAIFWCCQPQQEKQPALTQKKPVNTLESERLQSSIPTMSHLRKGQQA